MMRLYSGTTCPYSHRCRIVLFEKGMDFEVIDVDLQNKSEDVATINPYNKVPVLVERDLILYEANIINEYIDVAHAFFDAKDAKFVNGLLDSVAKAKRS